MTRAWGCAVPIQDIQDLAGTSAWVAAGASAWGTFSLAGVNLGLPVPKQDIQDLAGTSAWVAASALASVALVLRRVFVGMRPIIF